MSEGDASETRGWTGWRLDELSGATVGRIEGVYVDAHDGCEEWLVVRPGRLGTPRLVPARDAVEGAGHVWVPWERAVIRSTPAVEPGATLTAADELELCDHYGIRAAGGRAAAVAGRLRSELSSRPAA